MVEDKLVTKNLGDEILMNDWRLSVDMPFEEDAKKESINIEQYRCYTISNIALTLNK